jgi:hypothetical protein
MFYLKKSYFFVLTQNTLNDNECYLECYRNELMNNFKFYINLNDIDQVIETCSIKCNII